MAWRIHDAVIRGEIDNRTRGRVSGRIWISGRDEPVELRLQGNGLRDLAGCRLVFTNPAAVPGMDPGLGLLQEGVVGEMTASRRVQMPTVDGPELAQLLRAKAPVPSSWANCLYLEWFSSANGRVVIEAVHFQCELSEPSWSMSGAEEEQQRGENADAFAWYLGEAGEQIEEDDAEAEVLPALDEFEWERLLREADRRADRLMDLIERYQDHPDRDGIIAREMGWNSDSESPLASETGEHRKPGDFPGEAEAADPERHPLYLQAFDLAIRLRAEAEASGWLAEAAPGRQRIRSLVHAVEMTAAKVAGALGGGIAPGGTEYGFIVANLKRGLAFLHRGIADAGAAVRESAVDPHWLAEARDALLDLRQEVHRLMEEARGKMR